MNERETQEQLKRELAASEIRMQNCKHVFADPIYDPETVKVGYGSVQDGAGSDPHWSYEGYRDEKKDRWSRECTICGKKEFTNQQVPVIKGYAPKF